LKLLISSRNKDKIQEIKSLLSGLEIEIFSSLDFPDLPEVIEDKSTIKENAVKKAEEIAALAGMLTLADDTGLFVDALNGEPGVRAARFAGENCTYRDNRLKMLSAMTGKVNRSARFKTVVALASPGKLLAIAEGVVEGVIAEKETGDLGFGYDSIFRANETGKTFGEMTEAEKSLISHRGRALRMIIPEMQKILEIDFNSYLEKKKTKKEKENCMINPQIFRQYDVRGIVDKDLTDETVFLLGKGFGTYLRNLEMDSVVIGGDARLSSPRFKTEFTRGLMETGCNVKDVGILATPVLYFCIQELSVDAGVMITGSHNPPEYNGFKLNVGLMSIYGDEIQKILKIIESGEFAEGEGALEKIEGLIGIYQDYLVENIKLDRPVKVIVDAGNGAGGPIIPEILTRLGCEVTEMYCEMDGTFPNHHPDPTVVEYIRDLIQAVKTSDAEIGIGLDGDADRIGVVDENGDILFGDQILNVYARDFLKNNPGEKIVGDVKCSKIFYDDIKKYGGVPIMYKTGHSMIKKKMKEENVKLGGEMSGHIFFADRYFGYDDAIYAACRFIEILSKGNMKVSELLADQPKMYNTPEIRVDCPDDIKFSLVDKVRDSFIAEGAEVNDIDGMRVTFSDGWGLVRASNTQPVIVMRFEAETPERLDEIRLLIENRIKQLS